MPRCYDYELPLVLFFGWSQCLSSLSISVQFPYTELGLAVSGCAENPDRFSISHANSVRAQRSQTRPSRTLWRMLPEHGQLSDHAWLAQLKR